MTAGNNSKLFTDADRKKNILVQAAEVINVFAKDKAETLESADGGHSLKRHGPEITDEQLKDRLSSGIAADGAFSPTPGASTKFVSYEAYLNTRERVSRDMNATLTETRRYLKGDLNAYHNAIVRFNNADPGPDKGDLARVRNNKKKTVEDKVSRIGQTHKDYLPVKFNAADANPLHWIVTYGSYGVVRDHGELVGTGFQGRAGSEKDQVHPVSGEVKAGAGWSVHDDTGGINNTFSTLEVASGNNTPVFPGLNCNGWPFVQHFPSEKDTGYSV